MASTRSDKFRLLAGLVITEASSWSDDKLEIILELVQSNEDEIGRSAISGPTNSSDVREADDSEDLKEPIILRDLGESYIQRSLSMPDGRVPADALDLPAVKREVVVKAVSEETEKHTVGEGHHRHSVLPIIREPAPEAEAEILHASSTHQREDAENQGTKRTATTAGHDNPPRRDRGQRRRKELRQ